MGPFLCGLFSVARQLFSSELLYEPVSICVCATGYVCVKDQRPAAKEKLAASLILLRVALLLGLSMDKGVLVVGAVGGLVTAESSVLPGCSDGSHVPSLITAAATSSSSLSEMTQVQTELMPHERQERCN